MQYTLTLTPTTLEVDFKVDNSGEDAFSFTCLLHTYFSVDINSTGIQGLQGINYKDSLSNSMVQESNNVLKIQQEVDRIYENVPAELLITDDTRSVVVSKCGFEDVVVWNPWIDKSKAMADFEDLEYKNMVCVEVGNVAKAMTLESGQTWSGSQLLTLA